MKNYKTFIKKWKLNGLPYPGAEARADLEKAAVWLTDDPQRAHQLLQEGSCCVYLLTAENRSGFCSGIEWCAEAPESAAEPGSAEVPESAAENAEAPESGTVPESAEEAHERAAAGGRKALLTAPEAAGGWRGQLAEAEHKGLPDWLPEDFLWRVWLRSRGLPWHICETDRLSLREMTEADLDFLYELQRDQEAAGFLDALGCDREEELQKLAAYRKQMYGFYGFGIWIVEEKESGRSVGRAGLQMRDGFEEPELGFAVLKEYRGRGYAKEACRAVLHYAAEELELKRVRAVADRENIKSQRLCEKLGFAVDNTAEMDGRMCIFYSRRVDNF